MKMRIMMALTVCLTLVTAAVSFSRISTQEEIETKTIVSEDAAEFFSGEGAANQKVSTNRSLKVVLSPAVEEFSFNTNSTYTIEGHWTDGNGTEWAVLEDSEELDGTILFRHPQILEMPIGSRFMVVDYEPGDEWFKGLHIKTINNDK